MAQIISTFYELLKNYREASEEPKGGRSESPFTRFTCSTDETFEEITPQTYAFNILFVDVVMAEECGFKEGDSVIIKELELVWHDSTNGSNKTMTLS
ncbi:hypothetical protein YC2023_010313 [Brassica napus]